MPKVDAIHIAPVKSLALLNAQSVQVGPAGIVEDRRFYLVDERGRMLTQRQAGKLAQVRAWYDQTEDRLIMAFPDGAEVEGIVETAEEVATVIWGRRVDGHLVGGDWSRALSRFCGRPVFLVRPRQPGQCYDEYPISVLSRASVELLSQRAAVEPGLDHRRFRPNLLLDGCEPHEEDGWLGQSVAMGNELVLRMVAPDPRCAITTLDPDTGVPNLDTPTAILSYRPSPGPAYFGVYAVVERPGKVNLGRYRHCARQLAGQTTRLGQSGGQSVSRSVGQHNIDRGRRREVVVLVALSTDVLHQPHVAGPQDYLRPVAGADLHLAGQVDNQPALGQGMIVHVA